MVNGPIVIDKFKYECPQDDYKKISKNFKVINILYRALTIDIYESISHCKTLYYNVVLSEFVAQDKIIMDENVK